MKKVIIWGHKNNGHTHSHIHSSYFRAFKYMGFETFWFDDNEDVSGFDFENCLFFTEDQVQKNIPLIKNSKYILHHTNLEKYEEISVPFRRDSTFYALSHEENGFFDNKWKSQVTRWNQLRFHNEVSMNSDLVFGDGLSDLEFVEHGLTKENNITHINVGI